MKISEVHYAEERNRQIQQKGLLEEEEIRDQAEKNNARNCGERHEQMKDLKYIRSTVPERSRGEVEVRIRLGEEVRKMKYWFLWRKRGHIDDKGWVLEKI